MWILRSKKKKKGRRFFKSDFGMLRWLLYLSLWVLAGCSSDAIDKVDSFLHKAQYEVSSTIDMNFCYHGHSGTKQAYLSGMCLSLTLTCIH